MDRYITKPYVKYKIKMIQFKEAGLLGVSENQDVKVISTPLVEKNCLPFVCLV